jgi:hypothetical protein
MPYNTLHSPAWRSLSGPAVKVWFELRSRFHGGNNGRLILSYEEAAGLLGLGKSTVKRALDELQDKGFIVCVRQGKWYGRLASEWAVTDKGVKAIKHLGLYERDNTQQSENLSLQVLLVGAPTNERE